MGQTRQRALLRTSSSSSYAAAAAAAAAACIRHVDVCAASASPLQQATHLVAATARFRDLASAPKVHWQAGAGAGVNGFQKDFNWNPLRFNRGFNRVLNFNRGITRVLLSLLGCVPVPGIPVVPHSRILRAGGTRVVRVARGVWSQSRRAE